MSMFIVYVFLSTKPYTPPHSAPACSNPVKCQVPRGTIPAKRQYMLDKRDGRK